MRLTRARYAKRLEERLDGDLGDPRYLVTCASLYTNEDKKGDFKVNVMLTAPSEDFIAAQFDVTQDELHLDGPLHMTDEMEVWVNTEARKFMAVEEYQKFPYGSMDSRNRVEIIKGGCEMIANGGSTRDVSKRYGIPQSILIEWFNKYDSERYEIAKQARAQLRVEDLEHYKRDVLEDAMKTDKFQALVGYTKWMAATEHGKMYAKEKQEEKNLNDELRAVLSDIAKQKSEQQ